jgi:aspartate/methionine/tyrosine aminotransferase
MEAIHGDQGRVREMMKEYRSRRDLLVTGLNTLRGVRCLNPDGAFYVFPNITGTGMDDMTFARRMLDEAGVALLPGSNFGDAGVGHIRICYANSRGNISKGLERMDRLLH